MRTGSTGEGQRYVDEVRYFLGLIHHEAHDDGAALEVLEMVPPSSDRFADARALMARINEGLGENADALADIRRAIAADPDNTALSVYMAGVLGRSGNYDESISAMESLIAARPDDPDLYYDLGVIYSESGRDDLALEQMNQVLELESNHSSALNFVGYIWADQGERLDEAEQLIRQAIELRPDDGYITDSLGWVHYKRGLKLLAEGQGGGGTALVLRGNRAARARARAARARRPRDYLAPRRRLPFRLTLRRGHSRVPTSTRSRTPGVGRRGDPP